MCNCNFYNNLDEKFFGDENNFTKIETMLSLPYLQRRELLKSGKVTMYEMTEISKYKTKYGFSYMDNGIEIKVSPKKYFCKLAMWLSEYECNNIGIDWNNTCSPIPTKQAENTIIYKNNKKKVVDNSDQNKREVSTKLDSFLKTKLHRK